MFLQSGVLERESSANTWKVSATLKQYLFNPSKYAVVFFGNGKTLAETEFSLTDVQFVLKGPGLAKNITEVSFTVEAATSSDSLFLRAQEEPQQPELDADWNGYTEMESDVTDYGTDSFYEPDESFVYDDLPGGTYLDNEPKDADDTINPADYTKFTKRYYDPQYPAYKENDAKDQSGNVVKREVVDRYELVRDHKVLGKTTVKADIKFEYNLSYTPNGSTTVQGKAYYTIETVSVKRPGVTVNAEDKIINNLSFEDWDSVTESENWSILISDMQASWLRSYYSDLKTLLEKDAEGESTALPSSESLSEFLQKDPCFGLPNLQLPDIKLPNIQLPGFNTQEALKIPELNLCPASKVPIFKDGDLAKFFQSSDFQDKGKVQLDNNDPRAVPKEGGNTIVTVPTAPQMISAEVQKIAPAVQQSLLNEFGPKILSYIGNIGPFATGIVNGLAQKATALGDFAAQALGNTITTLLNAGEAAVADATNSVTGGLAVALTKASEMVGFHKIPVGFQHWDALKTGEFELFSDMATTANWAYNGLAGGALGAINNGFKLATDLYNNSIGQCFGEQAAWSLGNAAKLELKGLHIPALSLQLDGVLRNLVITPFHLNGTDITKHNWRFSCSELKNNIEQGVNGFVRSASEIGKKIGDMFAGAATGAMPGNLLYLAFGNSPQHLPQDFLRLLPILAALRLGSPFVPSLQNYTNDADSKHDGLTSQLPGMILAGNPKLQQLLDALGAFSEVLRYASTRTNSQIKHLGEVRTQTGAALVNFIVRARSKAASFAPLDKLGINFVTNKFSYIQIDELLALARNWDALAVDFKVISDPEALAAAHAVLDPRSKLGGLKLATLLEDPDSRKEVNTFGGHQGAEAAFIVSAMMILLRLLFILNQPNVNPGDVVKRTHTITGDSLGFIDDITFGNPLKDYIKSLYAASAPEEKQLPASVAKFATAGPPSIQKMVILGMGPATQLTQDVVKHLTSVTNALNTMSMEQRGVQPDEISKPSGEHSRKQNQDTTAFTSGALDNAHRAIKTTLTGSVASVGGSVKTAGDAKLTTKADNKKQHIEKITKETANPLAASTINKATGIRLDQQYEGSVKLGKFLHTQAGTSMNFESPVIRSSARFSVTQASLILHEGDSIDTRSQWTHHLADQSWGITTADFYIAAKDELNITAKKANYFGQTGTEIADRQTVRLTAVESKTTLNKSQLLLDKDGNAKMLATNNMVQQAKKTITVNAGEKVIVKAGDLVVSMDGTSKTILIKAGSAVIKMDGNSGKIDLNPSSPPIAPVVVDSTIAEVDIKYAEAPAIEKGKDLAAGVLPQAPGYNSVPCPAPYKQPGRPALAPKP